ncbi:extracellular solute-binding protein [Streptomyces fuscigenes]|uniref:extracellular solute-binding protein n=1 Tax=Streptomyces fuscigenes TaxID=1528880 RepID=UPI001F243B9B|nr:extracellular solute-binding protein [Streptomyces fuscigenes]MCF3964146.1 extracellular solute-binding protein [Streptomyces fuscigenes]
MTTAIAVLSTTVLAGCSGTTGSGGTTLRLVAADYGNSPETSSSIYWKKVASAFEKDHPNIKVDVDVRSWKTVDADVAGMVKDGDAPDMAQVGAFADYANEGKLYSADQILSVPVQSGFVTQLADAGKVNQVQYGLPFVASTRLLFYNRKLFENAGISAPKNWDDIESDAQALKSDGVSVPFALPLGTEESQAETMMWMLSGGGGYTSTADGSYSIDSDENVNTFKWLQHNLVGKGLTGPVAPAKLDRADAFKEFTEGKVGMLNGHPTLMNDARKAHIDFGMVPMPGKDGKAKNSMGVADWMMAFKQNGHAKEIGEFLDFAYDDKNVMDFVKQYDLLPVTYSANTLMAADKGHNDLREFQKTLGASELYPFGKSSWSQVSDTIKKNIGKAVEPGADPQQILTKISKDANAADAAASASHGK